MHPEIASFDYSWSIVSDPKKADYAESELKNIVATHTDIALEVIGTIIEYEKKINSFAFGSMEVLSWLVFLFGVINLINTAPSNQMSRKQCFAFHRSDTKTAMQNEHLRGAILYVLCNIGDADRWASGFHLCL